MKVSAEPAFPVAALETLPPEQAGGALDIPTAAAQAAEDQWEDDALLWGRAGWAQVARVCRWTERMGNKLPSGWCGPPPPATPPPDPG